MPTGFSYDPSTSLGRVRLLTSDTDPADHIFADDEIETFLGLEAQSIRRAAALALDVVAANELLILKKIRALDVSTDGPAVAQALRAQAAELRRQADQDLVEDTGAGFEIAELNVNAYAWRELLYNDALREGA